MTSETRRVVFVCPAATGESLRTADAISKLDGVTLLGICEDPATVSADFIRVSNVHDAAQLIGAAHELAERHGALNHIVTAQETLLGPVAQAREALNLPGMSFDTVCQTLDKSLLKQTLRNAGISTPADRIVFTIKDAIRFISENGFPIMLKPLSGSGALATLLIKTAVELDHALELMQPSIDHPVLAETYLHAQELCIDTITIDDEPQLYSICCYYPSILEALDHPETQWTCVMPREVDTGVYAEFIEQGLAAVRALSVGNSMTHMEGFVNAAGKVLGFTDATLRPAGARIGPMLGFAYDIDPYRAWARVAIDGCYDGPWERKYSAGTIFLRGAGSGLVECVEGIEEVNAELRDLIVDVSWPKIGARKSDTYTGDGYITVRHQDTDRVKTALAFVDHSTHIHYTSTESAQPDRSERFRNYKELNKPAWEQTARR